MNDKTVRFLRVAILVLLVASSVAVGVQTWRYSQQSQRLDQVISCQTAYYRAVSQALESRGASANAERARQADLAAASRTLWLQLLANVPAKPGQQTREAREKSVGALTVYLQRVDAYLRASGAAASSREDNPLPALRCTAGRS